MISQKSQEVPLVRCREALRLIANNYDARRGFGHLGCVVDLWTFELKQWWLVLMNCSLDQSIELSCGDAFVGLFEQHLGMVEQSFNIFAGLSRHKSDRAIGHCWKRFTNVTHPALCGHLTSELVPFVHDKDARLELVRNVMS